MENYIIINTNDHVTYNNDMCNRAIELLLILENVLCYFIYGQNSSYFTISDDFIELNNNYFLDNFNTDIEYDLSWSSSNQTELNQVELNQSGLTIPKYTICKRCKFTYRELCKLDLDKKCTQLKKD